MIEKQTINIQRILRVSTIIKWLCILALIVFGASAIFGGLSLHLSSDAAPTFLTGSQSFAQPLLLRLAALPYQLSICAVLICVVGMFDQYARGNIFTNQSVLWFRWFAFATLAAAILNALQGVFEALLRLIVEPQREVLVDVDLGTSDILFFGIAIILLAVASIQKEAQHKLDELRLIF